MICSAFFSPMPIQLLRSLAVAVFKLIKSPEAAPEVEEETDEAEAEGEEAGADAAAELAVWAASVLSPLRGCRSCLGLLKAGCG